MRIFPIYRALPVMVRAYQQISQDPAAIPERSCLLMTTPREFRRSCQVPSPAVTGRSRHLPRHCQKKFSEPGLGEDEPGYSVCAGRLSRGQ